MKKELLFVENGSIFNNGVEIIKSLYFNLFHGDSLGFVFDNALEKNILVDFLKGKKPLQTGKIAFENNKISTENYEKCFENNISVIERTSKLIRSLSVEENIFLFSSYVPRYFVSKHAFEIPIKEIENKLGINLRKYNSPVSLSEKDRVILEMVKAFAERKKIIAFSNITSFLKEPELDEVYTMMKKMRQFEMSFLIIEAFDEIIFRWSDNFVIIKHGKTMGIVNSKNVQSDKVFEMLLRDETEKKNPVAPVNNVEYDEWTSEIEFDHVSTEVLHKFSFTVGRGEVVKIYYMDDASGNHILELLKGERKAESGNIRIEGECYSVSNMSQAIKRGVGFIEEFAYENKLLGNLTAFENISLLLGEKVPMFWLRRRFRKNIRNFLDAAFDAADLDKKPEEIQPVDLQRMAYYKWYLYNPKVVVCIRPFAQEDVHVRETTVLMIEMLRNRGITVIILLSAFSEIDLVDGENIFVHNGTVIDEDGVYQFLYGGK
ncbi:ATP-binding cassette domain-containing protein [Anaerocolumna sp. MB42-C2]|uniref:ATP-binding cassette domain-containing protein n=1 Tax=Anaerocolumna sp. MB42-C2 TaxID=3070997 RepID=UPI0027DED895|nr:ATP-binding cassette domain-containing protein [Anaerocolumna sp. MB42-C2]WMJ90509.1 ATP-binding cassette domain-containing protein [Anaerocolumna sp. MB42-C2]